MTSSEEADFAAKLSLHFDGVERLRAQAPSAHVVAGCACGCPTIDFIVGRSSGTRHVEERVENAGVGRPLPPAAAGTSWPGRACRFSPGGWRPPLL